MVRVFCDFDGTIALEDVGDLLSRRFAGDGVTEIIREYRDGSITAKECLIRKCAAVPHLLPAQLEQFVDGFGLDPTFGRFVDFCTHREFPLVVLSDGLDFYVERLLKKHGFSHLPFFANHLEFHRKGAVSRMIPSFPYADAECPACGNCKRNHLLTLSGEEDVIVYVGDGNSDRCPVRFADVVFAKGRLIRHCQDQNITYHGFRDFEEVRSRFEFLLQGKRIKKRREAEMARREVYSQG